MHEEKLLPIEDENLRKALQELQAHVGAVSILLTRKQIVTEHELRQAFTQADRHLEERRTRTSQESIAEHREALNWQLRHVAHLIRSCYPSSEISVILPQLNADLTQDGMFIRVVADFPVDESVVEARLQTLLTRYLDKCEYASWLFPITFLLLAPDAATTNPVGLKFDILARKAVAKATLTVDETPS